MTDSELREAIELTVGGIGTVFLILVLLVFLVLLTRWIVDTRFGRGKTGAVVASETTMDQRDKALASAIAITVALAEAQADGQAKTTEEASV